MLNQVLSIEPKHELKFKVDFSGIFEQGCTTSMRLENPTNDIVFFKIKTTAPKKYCVRPNSGVLEAGSKIDIEIIPQHVFVDPGEKHKHKFMVQSVIAPEGNTNIDQVWKEISPDQLMVYKLKCVFETPRETDLNDVVDNAAQNDAARRRVAVADEAMPPPSDPYAVEGIKADGKKKSDETDKLENYLQKARSEMILLREEEGKLRHENLQLKEELLRLRQAVGEIRAAARRHSYRPERTGQSGLIPWVVCAIAIAIVSIIIGKFLL